MLQLNLLLVPSQVMLDFQAAERQSLEEPASDVGLETLCALVRSFLSLVCTFSCSMSVLATLVSYYLILVLFEQINNNLRCYELSSELSSSTLEALPPNYAEQVLMSHQAWSLDSFTFSNLLWR